jgi:hypothetical protein
VQKVVRGAQARLIKCSRDAADAATADVRFTVRADGTTKNVVAHDASGASIDAACVKKVVSGLRFPSASAETRVVLPIAR